MTQGIFMFIRVSTFPQRLEAQSEMNSYAQVTRNPHREAPRSKRFQITNPGAPWTYRGAKNYGLRDEMNSTVTGSEQSV